MWPLLHMFGKPNYDLPDGNHSVAIMWQAVASHSCHRETFGHSVAISVVLTGNLSPVLFSMLVEALKEIEKQGSRNELRRHKHTKGYAYSDKNFSFATALEPF